MRFNLNQFLKLHIRGKLAIAFAGLSIVPVLIVGILGISKNVQSLHQVAIENLTHDLLAIKEQLRSFFQGLEDNIYVITASPSFQNFVHAVNKQDELEISRTSNELFPELISFAQHKGIFYQIKFINSEGDDIFIIEQKDDQYRVLTSEELNKSGANFYLYLARNIPANQATFVPVELISRNFQRLLPAISCVYPVHSENFAGLLIFQIYAQTFFKIFEQQTPHSTAGKVMLVNVDGHYLYHSQKKWNQLLASKDVLNLRVDYGEEMAGHLLSHASKSFFEIDEEIVAHAPLFDERAGLENEYTILKSVSTADIFKPAQNFQNLFWGFLGLFLATSLLLAYLATRQFTEPIQKLRREAEIIAKGDYQSRVYVQTFDEIAELAQQFNIMAESLEQREAEINRHRQQLEQMVRARTKELEKEKNKLQVILDNVPSGFILLDEKYKILTASAALKSITGQPVEDLLGKSCYEVIGNDRLCSGCPTEQVFSSGKMTSQLVHRLNADGDERYLEYISVPLKRDGQVENVLEIITDVTERKRLQDQLLRSERLAATGEMAAVIAHEMRNSLTSVRMILQLFRKTEPAVTADPESLDVALDSLSRMERVVSDLLQLARPTQLEKRPGNINEIMQDSIVFAKHQITRKGIELEVKLASDMPDIELDHEQMKEALVNLILNAAQAIETTGKIRARSRLTALKKKLRDLGAVRMVGNENVGMGVKEVVLNQGTRVIEMEVKDSGCGISLLHLSRIFDPFFTTKVNGTGLGLSFVKRVVNEHDGIITVESQEGKGSCFTIYLPLRNSLS